MCFFKIHSYPFFLSLSLVENDGSVLSPQSTGWDTSTEGCEEVRPTDHLTRTQVKKAGLRGNVGLGANYSPALGLCDLWQVM